MTRKLWPCRCIGCHHAVSLRSARTQDWPRLSVTRGGMFGWPSPVIDVPFIAQVDRSPLERDSYRRRQGRKGGYRDAANMIDAVGHLAGARRLRAVAPVRHVGADGHVEFEHARRQELRRHADDERQRQANRQETSRDRRHAGKTWAVDERGSTLLGGSDVGHRRHFGTSRRHAISWTHYPRRCRLPISACPHGTMIQPRSRRIGEDVDEKD
jgi:hypothetical protein